VVGAVVIVLAIDPSSRCLGFALFDGERLDHAWSTELIGPSLGERLAQVEQRIWIAITTWHPAATVIETPGPWTRPKERSSTRTVEVLAMVRGVIMACAQKLGVPSHEMAVNTARHIITGKGNTGKAKAHEVLAMMGFDLPRKRHQRAGEGRQAGQAAENVADQGQGEKAARIASQGVSGEIDQDAADAVLVGLAWIRQEAWKERVGDGAKR
jgi:Holliday junction resolvasome RuvABC endonuclease subunit